MASSTLGEWGDGVGHDLDRWREHLEALGRSPWRPIRIATSTPSNVIKEGDLVRCGETQDSPGRAQWNIFFFQQTGLDMEVFEKRINAHPFVAGPERQGEEQLGGHLHWNL